MSIVKGFGGMRVRDNKVHFSPHLPDQWKSVAFKVGFRGGVMNIKVDKQNITVENLSGSAQEIVIYNDHYSIEAGRAKSIAVK